ncbi:MAG: hypothetical protein JW740_02590 [Candidatus Zambryskibacteria bacterium]|nr:hypothetical protein [Candidatus Zambryskibacteria bacterium]
MYKRTAKFNRYNRQRIESASGTVMTENERNRRFPEKWVVCPICGKPVEEAWLLPIHLKRAHSSND